LLVPYGGRTEDSGWESFVLYGSETESMKFKNGAELKVLDRGRTISKVVGRDG